MLSCALKLTTIPGDKDQMTETGRPRAGIAQRIRLLKRHPVWRPQHDIFVKTVSALVLPSAAAALSVSCGDGSWDWLAFASNPDLKSIVATDVVDCPVTGDDVTRLNRHGAWSYQKVTPDRVWPFDDNCFDLVFHMDVLEHTSKPGLFLSENYRVLKSGGYLLCGTPNIFRPANVLKLLLGKLAFPCGLGPGIFNPRYLNPGIPSDTMTHVQEFNQYQLRIMLEEAGFEMVSTDCCFFGVSFLKLKFKDFPVGNLGRNLCQYLFCVAQKRR